MATVSVYIPDDAYERIRVEVLERDLTVSSYLVRCSDPLGDLSKIPGGSQLDRIEKKVNFLVKLKCGAIETIKVPAREDDSPEFDVDAVSDMAQGIVGGIRPEEPRDNFSDVDLEEANERLKKKRTEIKGAIKTAKDVPKVLGYSKDKQLGKKGNGQKRA